jgi:hypothetical protein
MQSFPAAAAANLRGGPKELIEHESPLTDVNQISEGRMLKNKNKLRAKRQEKADKREWPIRSKLQGSRIRLGRRKLPTRKKPQGSRSRPDRRKLGTGSKLQGSGSRIE